jgi:hypothetical protein
MAREKNKSIAQTLKTVARILLYKEIVVKENGQLSVDSEMPYGCGILKLTK